MKKAVDFVRDELFPFLANKEAKCKLYSQIDSCEKSKSIGIHKNISELERVESDTLIQYYHDSISVKDKLEDKAKTSVFGITIAITLILGAADLLKVVSEKYMTSIMEWIVFVLLVISVAYLLLAGILVVGVLVDENTIHTVALQSYASNERELKLDISNATKKNWIRNNIRNNFVFTSYRCIRNALICLFIVLVISTVPIHTSSTQNEELKNEEAYTVAFTEEVMKVGENYNETLSLENVILTAVEQRKLTESSEGSFGIVDYEHGLYVKCRVYGDVILAFSAERCDVPGNMG